MTSTTFRPLEEQSDEALITAIQARNSAALGVLYDRYSSVLKALAIHVLHNEAGTEDLLQDVFVELWNHASDFSPKKGKLLGWMITLTRRRAIDRLRKRQAYLRAEDRLKQAPEAQPLAWTENSTNSAIDRSDIRAVLLDALRHIPPEQERVIKLSFFKGMTQREIAAHTNTPLGTVKTRLELGLRKITEALHPYRNEF